MPDKHFDVQTVSQGSFGDVRALLRREAFVQLCVRGSLRSRMLRTIENTEEISCTSISCNIEVLYQCVMLRLRKGKRRDGYVSELWRRGDLRRRRDDEGG